LISIICIRKKLWRRLCQTPDVALRLQSRAKRLTQPPLQPRKNNREIPAMRGYFCAMSFAEVLAELPALTIEQRQQLIRRALELENPPLGEADEALVESRLAAHRQNPASAVPLDEMKARLRNRIAR
jgi:putative addiction module component (TIGR02574 family)